MGLAGSVVPQGPAGNRGIGKLLGDVGGIGGIGAVRGCQQSIGGLAGSVGAQGPAGV